MNNASLPCLFVCMMICLIIGLPTYFTGCEKTIQPTCSNYWIKTTTVKSHGAKAHSCTRCIHSSKTCTTNSNGDKHCTTKCDVYEYYQCYDGYDIESYQKGNKNYTCKFTASRNDRSYDTAISNAQNEYPLGNHYDRYVNKQTDVCYTSSTIVGLAITGFTFLLLSAILLLAMIIIAIMSYIENNGIPSIPSIPSLPSLPSLPLLPSLPSLPSCSWGSCFSSRVTTSNDEIYVAVAVPSAPYEIPLAHCNYSTNPTHSTHHNSKYNV